MRDDKRLTTESEEVISDSLATFLDAAGRFLFWIGVFATGLSVGMLVFTYYKFANGGDATAVQQALKNIGMFKIGAIAGVLALGIGAAINFWGEETLGVILIGIAAAMYFAPMYLGGSAGSNIADAGTEAIKTVQTAGGILGMIGVIALVIDLLGRVQTRAKVGSKADTLKYGKNIREQRDVRNVLLGKCWQLPYCRKFVRDKCPIYHARVTCWRERVGCMCEEAVIQNAMEGKTIPRDVVAAAQYIPRNSKMSPEMKAERCRQCVIYNEHQKHKYKVALPLMIVVFASIYLLGRPVFAEGLRGALENTDKIVGALTLQSTNTQAPEPAQTQPQGPQTTDGKSARYDVGKFPFHEVLLVCIFLVAFAYTMHTLEYLIFRLKL